MSEETTSMWAEMFGLGPFLRMATDPKMVAEVVNLMRTMAENARAAQRIEQKLDFILESMGHDGGRFTAVFTEFEPYGAGGPAVAGGVADNGNRLIAAPARNNGSDTAR